MYTLEGVGSVANVITAYEKSQYNRDFLFLICRVFFVSKGNLFNVYFTSPWRRYPFHYGNTPIQI